jgi:predicted DNA-binding transcriptional regulator AlpA
MSRKSARRNHGTNPQPTTPLQTPASIKTVDKKTVCAALGVSPATLMRWISEKRFPPPIKASRSGKCRWRLSVVEEHLRQLEADAAG